MDEELNRDEPGPRRRPWYRWHWTTYLILLLPLAFLALLAVPGYTVSWSSVANGVVEFQEHGWPLVHMDRIAEEPEQPIVPNTTPDPAVQFDEELRSLPWLRWADHIQGPPSFPYQDVGPGWPHLSNWAQWGIKTAVHWWALAINLLTALVICAAVVAPYEWWCRHRWHYSLRTLLGMFVVAAAVFGCARWLVDERDREKEVEGQLKHESFDCEWEYWGPEWFRRLAAPGYLSDYPSSVWPFSMLCSIRSIDGFPEKRPEPPQVAGKPFDPMAADTAAVWKMVALAAKLRHLRRVRLSECPGRCVSLLSPLKGLTELEIRGGDFSPEAWTAIAAMQQLEVLVIDDGSWNRGIGWFPHEGTSADLSGLRFLKNLKSLTLRTPNVRIAGIGGLAHLARLEHLEIDAPVSDDALAHLKDFLRLNYLGLENERLTDAAVEDLQRQMPNLPVLHRYPDFKSWVLSDHAHDPEAVRRFGCF